MNATPSHRVTWLLPVKDGMPFLPETLASIAAQTHRDFEVIAWDNGSTDGTAAELARWIPSRLPGRVVTGRPLRLGASLAAMVEMAETELCARIDADDVNEPERLAAQVAFMAAHQAVAVVGSNMTLIGRDSRPIAGAWEVPCDDAAIRWRLRFCNAMNHPTVMFRRSAVLAAGNYDRRTAVEDFDLWVRVGVIAEMANLPEPLVRYRCLADRQRDETTRVRARTIESLAPALFPRLRPDEARRLQGMLRFPNDQAVRLRDIRLLKKAAVLAAGEAGRPDSYFLRTPLYKHQRANLAARWVKSWPGVRGVVKKAKVLINDGPHKLVRAATRPGPPPEREREKAKPQLTIMAARFWPDRHGGVETHMLHMARTLAGHGQAVRVLTENRTGAAERETLVPGLEVRRFAPPRCGPLWRWPILPRLAWWVNVLRRDGGHGALWATDPIMALAGMIAGRRGEMVYNPAACTAGMRQVGAAYAHVVSMRRPRLLMWLDKLAYRMARRVVVSSENLAEQYERFFGQRAGVHVVPLGVEMPPGAPRSDGARARWGLAPGAFVVGFVGRLDPCKDLGFLFEAFAEAELGAEARLLIAGAGPDRARLDALAAQLGVAERIVWTGALDDPRDAYAAMDVMVLPSVYEAFGSVVLEAMAAGVPVIGRRRSARADSPVLTASDELIRDGRNGAIVEPHAVDGLARKLSELALRPAMREAMGANARLFASACPWSRNAMTSLTIAQDPGAMQTPLQRAA